MQAPPPSEFVAMDRVIQLYNELPNLFAKDIARRQQSHAAQHLPGQTPSPALKRDRSDDSSDPTNKRRDTGDTKMAPTPVSSNSSPHQPSVLPSAPISAPHNVPLHGVPPSNASMPPPSVHSMPGVGSNDAQIAASRARQLQMRQALQQQQLGDGNRQMSPPGVQQPGMQGTGLAGPSTPQQQQQAQLSAIASMGPAAIQAYQILQSPSHPIVQYLNQNIPSFSSLPLQQQLQRVQMVVSVNHGSGRTSPLTALLPRLLCTHVISSSKEVRLLCSPKLAILQPTLHLAVFLRWGIPLFLGVSRMAAQPGRRLFLNSHRRLPKPSLACSQILGRAQ